MLSLLSLSIILTLILGAQAYSASFGERLPYDHILFRQTELRQSIEDEVWNMKVEFPCVGSINYFTISAIYVYDNFAYSSGTAPSLWRGGVGAKEVTINLQGEVSRGINSTIEIWGVY